MGFWTAQPPPRTPEQDAADAFLFSFATGKNRYGRVSDAPFSRWYLLFASCVMLFPIGAFYIVPIDSMIYTFGGSSIARPAFHTALGVMAVTVAFLGPWVERHGPRATACIGTTMFFIGNIVLAIAANSQSTGGTFVGYGVISAIGMGLCLVAPVSALQKWFPDVRGLATGFAISGIGAGAAVWRKEYQVIIANTSVSSMFLIFALGMCPVMLFCSMILRSPPTDFTVSGRNIHGEIVEAQTPELLEAPTTDEHKIEASATLVRRLTLGRSITSLDFVVLCLVFFANEMFGWAILPFLRTMCRTDFKQTSDDCLDLITHNDIFNCCGRLVLPLLSDLLIKLFKLEPSFGRKCILVCMLIVQLILVGMLPTGIIDNRDYAKFETAIYVLTSIYGGGFGLIPCFLADMFGIYNVGTMFGLVLTTWPIGSLLGDSNVAFTGTHVQSINAVLVILIIGFVLVFLVRTNPKDRFAPGYRISICGCTIINTKPNAIPDTEHTQVKDGDAYAALPDTPTLPTVATAPTVAAASAVPVVSPVPMPPTVPAVKDPPTKAVDFPAAQALVQYRIPLKDIAFGPVISQGGYGEVLRATYNNQAVAVKRMLRKDPNSIRRFVDEIKLTATLDHECLVQFIGAAWDDPSSLCMISEFMYGGDLRTLLARYARTGYANGHDDNKLRIAVQVAHATAYLHSLTPPVIHRDLKSKNVLLTASMDAKVIDFGVSREQEDQTMTANVGTSLWMAPEIMLGKRYDEKADIFSFGVILSELDTHELPYDHARDTSTNQKLSSMILQQLITQGRLKPRFTDKAHPAIVALARDCLEVNPRQRPSASELVYRINQCLQYEPILTEQTRSAMDRSVLTVETLATTRYSPKTKQDTFRISSASFETPSVQHQGTYEISHDTRATTRQ